LSVTCDRRWFSLGTLVSSTNKTDRHNISEIVLKMALNTKTLPPNPKFIKDVSARVLNSEFTRTNK